FLDGKLYLVSIIFDAGLNLHEVITLKGGDALLKAIPHASLDPARRIAQLKAQISFSFASGANFLFTDKKMGGDNLIGLKSGDEALLHASGVFLGRIKSLLPDFFFTSSFSGAAATSSIAS